MTEIMALSESKSYHVYHDWEDVDLSASIGVCLLEATDRDLDDLGTPLYDVIDTDALVALLKPRGGERGTAEQVQFTIDGYTVTISSLEDIAHIIVHRGETPLSERPLP